MILKRVSITVFLAAGMVALWIFAATTFASIDASQLTIGINYPDGGSSVEHGETFTPTVRFERTDVSNQVTFGLELSVPSEGGDPGRPVFEASDSTRIDNVQYRDGKMRILVSMNGEGYIDVNWPITAKCDVNESGTECNQFDVLAELLNTNGEQIQLQMAEVDVDPDQFNIANISIEAGAISDESTDENLILESEVNCVPRCKPVIVAVTNNNSEAARVLLRATLPAGLRWAQIADDEEDSRLVDANRRTRLIDITVAAGDVYVEELSVVVSSDASDAASFEMTLQACAEPAGEINCPLPAGGIDMAPITFVSARRDVGDAPDSSNHASVNMPTGYGAVGNFPTTIDTALAGPHGPAHARPSAMHLGRGYSSEMMADIGPDMDGVNNLETAALTADLDRFDDGVPLSQIEFVDCKEVEIPVRISILPRTVQYYQENDAEAFINIWLDSNRDGDWADSGPCDGNAVEHIVIDQPVDVVALGAGIHSVMVKTSQVSWPAESAEQPAWMRVTLAEQKSTKLTGESYGDGRGNGIYLLGETEDYLYYPADAESNNGDLELTMELVERGDERRADLVFDRAPDSKLRFAKSELIIRFRNKGSKPLNNLEIDLQLGDLSQIVGSLYTGWLTCVVRTADGEIQQTIAIEVPDETTADESLATLDLSSVATSPTAADGDPVRLELLSSLAPESWGLIVVEISTPLTQVFSSSEPLPQHTVSARTTGKQWERKVDVQELMTPRQPELVLGWSGCLTCTGGEGASLDRLPTTVSALDTQAPFDCYPVWDACSEPFMVTGVPGTSFKVLKNGAETGQTGEIGADGSTMIEIERSSGDSKLIYQVVSYVGDNESAPSDPVDVSCPASGVQILGMQTAEGKPISFKPQNGADNKDGIRVVAGDKFGGNNLTALGEDQSYLIYRQCREQETEMSLNFLGEDIELTEVKRFNNVFVLSWTGCLTCVRSVDNSLITMSAMVTDTNSTQAVEYETTFDYLSPYFGQITDRDGEPIEDVEITILRRAKRGGKSVWVAMESSVFIVVDPMTWGAQVPAGEYIVIAKKDGYQPYRSQPILFFDEADSLFDTQFGRYQLSFDIIMNTAGRIIKDIVDVEDGNAGLTRNLAIKAGEAVLFNNFGATDIQMIFEPSDTTSRAAVASIDSGVIAPQESFSVELTEPGEYTYRIVGNDSQVGTITVEASGTSIFLPYITR